MENNEKNEKNSNSLVPGNSNQYFIEIPGNRYSGYSVLMSAAVSGIQSAINVLIEKEREQTERSRILKEKAVEIARIEADLENRLSKMNKASEFRMEALRGWNRLLMTIPEGIDEKTLNTAGKIFLEALERSYAAEEQST